MTQATAPFVSEADVAVADPAALAGTLADYWASLDVEIERGPGRLFAKLGAGEGLFEIADGALKVTLRSHELGSLELLRGYLTESLSEFAGDGGARIAWRGNMRDARTFADFREVRLVSARDVAPRVRRLVFTGDDVSRFGSESDIHVRMYFPPAGLGSPEWPRPGPDGRTIWPPDERRPEIRYYTIRRFDRERAAIEVDFVMHADEGPGSAFAARAEIGAVVGMAGPLGRSVPRAGWTLLAGDETALPAIARILESMPKDARGAAFIEVDCAADELAIDAPEGVALRWLHRRGAPAGATDLLPSAVAGVAMPEDGDVFAWVACEHSASRIIRKHLRTQRKLEREKHLVVAYWQREEPEAQAA